MHIEGDYMQSLMEVSGEDYKFFATTLTEIEVGLDYGNWSNSYSADRLGGQPSLITLCNKCSNEHDEPALEFHIRVKESESQYLFKLAKRNDRKIDYDFTIGDLNEESLKLIKAEMKKVLQRVKADVYRKKRRESGKKTGGPNPKNLKGLYVWRGSIVEGDKYWSNYEEAIRLKIASPELVETMKKWGLHFHS